MKIVIIGGTGLIGSKTAAILRQSGHEVIAASPNPDCGGACRPNSVHGKPRTKLHDARDS
jgi:uncharacterized protein YbjT (DUF2867 family)